MLRPDRRCGRGRRRAPAHDRRAAAARLAGAARRDRGGGHAAVALGPARALALPRPCAAQGAVRRDRARGRAGGRTLQGKYETRSAADAFGSSQLRWADGRWLQLPVRRRPGGAASRAPRVRRAAGRVGAGGAARAVRDPHAQHGRRAHGGRLSRVDATGTVDEQAIALRDAMRVLFPEAVALVSAARQGFMRDAGRSPGARPAS